MINRRKVLLKMVMCPTLTHKSLLVRSPRGVCVSCISLWQSGYSRHYCEVPLWILHCGRTRQGLLAASSAGRIVDVKRQLRIP